MDPPPHTQLHNEEKTHKENSPTSYPKTRKKSREYITGCLKKIFKRVVQLLFYYRKDYSGAAKCKSYRKTHRNGNKQKMNTYSIMYKKKNTQTQPKIAKTVKKNGRNGKRQNGCS